MHVEYATARTFVNVYDAISWSMARRLRLSPRLKYSSTLKLTQLIAPPHPPALPPDLKVLERMRLALYAFAQGCLCIRPRTTREPTFSAIWRNATCAICTRETALQ